MPEEQYDKIPSIEQVDEVVNKYRKSNKYDGELEVTRLFDGNIKKWVITIIPC